MRLIGGLILLTITAVTGFTVTSEHHVTQVSKFTTQVKKQLDMLPTAVFFYNNHGPNSKGIDAVFAEFDKVAVNLRGMLRLFACDCESTYDNRELCKSEAPKVGAGEKSHAIVVYRLLPQSSKEWSSKKPVAELEGYITGMIPGAFVKTVTAADEKAFLANEPNKPKLLWFTNSADKTPALFARALSVEFRKEMNFAQVSSSESSLVSKYAVSKYPTLILVDTDVARSVKKYTGGFDAFVDVSEWVGLRRQTFVHGSGWDETGPGSGAGKKASDSNDKNKPWLAQEVPELSKLSRSDICPDNSSELCVLFLASHPLAEGDKELEWIKTAKRHVETETASSTSGAGKSLRFAYVDCSSQVELCAMMTPKSGMPTAGQPKAVVVSSSKKLKFVSTLERTVAAEQALYALDKIHSGDAQYTVFKGSKWPILAKPVEKNATQGGKSTEPAPGSSEL